MPDLPSFHGWTHRPKAQGGTDPVPFPETSWVLYRWYKETDQTIGTGSDTLVAWTNTPATADGWYSGDGFVKAGNAADAHDTGLTTTNGLFPYATGIWHVGYELEWETGNYGKKSVLQFESGASSVEPLFGLDWAGTLTSNSRNVHANQLLAQDPVDTGRPTYHHHKDMWNVKTYMVDDDFHWCVYVKQTSGSDKTITKAKLTALWIQDPLAF